MNTSFNQSQGTLDAYRVKMQQLAGIWQSRSATYSLHFDATSSANVVNVAQQALDSIRRALRNSGNRTLIEASHRLARGGIVRGATSFVAGEAGTEAVIPLERNLGWMDKMATAISAKVADIQLPLIAQGNILPVTEAFMNTAGKVVNDSDVPTLLQSILERLNALEIRDSSNREPIMLQLDSRIVAEVVWDETEKRYKQTGVRYAY